MKIPSAWEFEHSEEWNNLNKKLEQKISTGRRLTAEFAEQGISASLDEKTGEVTVKASDFIKARDKRCPECGRKLILFGKTPVCPTCDC